MFQHNSFISLPVVTITNHHPVITSVSLSYKEEKEYMTKPKEQETEEPQTSTGFTAA
jgi:hypothetical protein